MTIGPERPESSVSPTLDEYGQVCFPGSGSGAVIHRTPEELGIPRVVRDAPEFVGPEISAVVAATPEALRAARWPTGATLETMERKLGLRAVGPRKVEPRGARPSRDSLKGVKPRVVRGVEVRMSAHAVMGAELIDGLAAESQPAEKEKVEEMPRGTFSRPTNELKLKVLAEPDAEVADLVARLGATKSQVYNWRHEARKKDGASAGKKNGSRPKKILADRAPAKQLAAAGPGYGPALSLALARHDSRAVRTIRLDLSEMEVATLVGKLNGEQRGAFLAAGLKAAILG